MKAVCQLGPLQTCYECLVLTLYESGQSKHDCISHTKVHTSNMWSGLASMPFGLRTSLTYPMMYIRSFRQPVSSSFQSSRHLSH